MTYRLSLIFLCAVLSGCATSRLAQQSSASEPPAAVDDTYLPVAGREAAIIDALRAAAPPAQAEILAGKSLAADQTLLRPQSYVLIGNSRHRHDDESARAWIAEQGRNVGADKIRWYPQAQAGDAATDASGAAYALTAAYFVRLRLVFGATFRDLNAQERKAFPVGVRLGDVVGESPASRANLRSGDIVTALNGKPVDDRAGFQALLREHMGRTVELTLGRGGETLRRRISLGRTFGDAGALP